MNASAALRPLGLGEIFDRAVNLLVSNAVTIGAIVAAVTIPRVLCFAISGGIDTGFFQAILHGKAPVAPVHPFNVPMLVVAYLITIIAVPFSYVVVGTVVATVYAGASTTWTKAYSRAFGAVGRWLLTLLVAAAAVLASYVAGAIVIGILVFFAIMLAHGSPSGMVFGFVIAVLGVAWLLTEAVVLISLGIALFAAAVERRPAADALAFGFRAVWNRSEMLRSVAFALALIACYIAFFAIEMGLLTIAMLVLRLPALSVAIETVVSICASGFLATLFSVYFFDLRVRREGLDLESRLSELEGATSA